MQYTDNMELLLYESNDIMQTTDFVNTNNQKIDEFTAAVKVTAEEANASAVQANQGVSAADAKITQIQTSITQNGLSSLPQFKQDTEDRLGTLEDDVAGLSGWSKFLTNSSGNPAGGIYKSSIGVYRNAFAIGDSSWIQITETVIYLDGGSVTIDFKYKCALGSTAGNIFNAVNAGVIYTMNDYSIDTQGVVHTAGLGFKWDGVSTTIYVISTANIRQYFLPEIFPITGNPL